MQGKSEAIRRIKEGDKHEFEELFRSSYASLVRYATTMTRDSDLSEEIVQELFYRLWLDRKKLTRVSSLNGYLYRSVHNRVLRHLEHQKVVSRYAGEVLAGGERASDQVTDTIYYNELRARVEKVLERLPQRCSMIFRMSRYEGLKYSEIAERLSISQKTVEADMGKALKEFRKALAE